VLIYLITRASFSKKLIESTLKTVTLSKLELDVSLSIISSIFVYQSSETRPIQIEAFLLDYLLNQEKLLTNLEGFAQNTNVDSFILAFSQYLITVAIAKTNDSAEVKLANKLFSNSEILSELTLVKLLNNIITSKLLAKLSNNSIQLLIDILSKSSHVSSTRVESLLQAKMDSYKNDKTLHKKIVNISTSIIKDNVFALTSDGQSLDQSLINGNTDSRLTTIASLSTIEHSDKVYQRVSNPILECLFDAEAIIREKSTELILSKPALRDLVTAEKIWNYSRANNKSIPNEIVALLFESKFVQEHTNVAVSLLFGAFLSENIQWVKFDNIKNILAQGSFPVSCFFTGLDKIEANEQNFNSSNFHLSFINHISENISSSISLEDELLTLSYSIQNSTLQIRNFILVILGQALSKLTSKDSIITLGQFFLSALSYCIKPFAIPKGITLESPNLEKLIKKIPLHDDLGYTAVPLALFCVESILKAIQSLPIDGNTLWLDQASFEDQSLQLIDGTFVYLAKWPLNFSHDLLSKLTRPYSESMPELLLREFALTGDSGAQARIITLLYAYLKDSLLQSSASFVDYQILIPQLCIGLASQDLITRQSTLKVFELLDEYYNEANIPSSKTKNSKSSKSKSNHYKATSFYGTQSRNDLIFLTTEQVRAFIQCILAHKMTISSTLTDLSTILGYFANESSSTKDLNTEVLGSFLLSNAVNFPLPESQIQIIHSLSSMNFKSKLKIVSTLLSDLLEKVSKQLSLSSAEGKLLEEITKYFSSAALSLSGSNKVKYMNIFTFALGLTSPITVDNQSTSVCQLTLKIFTEDFFKQFSAPNQSQLFRALINVSSTAEESLARLAKGVVRDINASTQLYIEILTEISDQIRPEVEMANKKAKVENDLNQDSILFSQLISLLEIMDSVEPTSNLDSLVAKLSDLITIFIDLGSSIGYPAFDYAFQLIFSVATTICKFDSSVLTTTPIRMDSIVQCLRLSTNPQTHNSALLLLATISQHSPEQVLHNIMPLFTFMGTNVTRKDDNYSFYVIEQALSTIMPVLIQSYLEKSDNAQQSFLEAKPIIAIFINALLHIPAHRRLRLITVLVNSMGADTYLYPTLGLLLDKYSIRHVKPVKDSADEYLEFCQDLLSQFSVEIQLNNLNLLLKDTLLVPNENPKTEDQETEQQSQPQTVYEFSERSDKQIRHYKLGVVQLIKMVTSSDHFLQQVVLLQADPATIQEFENHYLPLAQTILLMFQDFKDYLVELGQKSEINKNIDRFFRGLISLINDVLTNVLNTLSSTSILLFISEMLQHSRYTVRQFAIHLLNTRIGNLKPANKGAYMNSFVKMVPLLVKIVKGESAQNGEESTTNRQTALHCLGMLIKTFATPENPHHPNSTFINVVLPIAAGPHGLENDNLHIVASSFVCLTYLSRQLGPLLVKKVNSFAPKAIDRFINLFNTQSNDSGLRVAVLSGLALVDSLVISQSDFIGPYLGRVMDTLLVVQTWKFEESSKSSIVEHCNDLSSSLIKHISPRSLLPVVYDATTKALELGGPALVYLFNFLTQVIVSIPKSDISQYSIKIFKYILSNFDYRYSQKQLGEELDSVEVAVIRSLFELIVRLDDGIFKPILLKLIDWGTIEKQGSEEGTLRSTVFYRLIQHLLSELGELISPVFTYLVKHSVSELASMTLNETNQDLWKYILQSISLSNQHDNVDIWNLDNYNTLLQALLHQVDTVTDIELATTNLVPCFTSLILNIDNENAWKKINHEILVKTRSETYQVILAF
jgi:hypothetical protein